MEEINFDALSKEYGATNDRRQKANELKMEQRERIERILVSTCDLKQDYEIIGPVYIQINNRGGRFNELKSKYKSYIENVEKSGQGSNDKISNHERMEILFANLGTYNGHTDFDIAFFIAVEELKERAALLNADAVIGMRQDIDLDSNGFQYFYLQMYGTAVKFK